MNMKELSTQEKIVAAYKKGFDAGKRRGKEGSRFPDGVDWHIVGITCDCGQDICPVADNADEDIKLNELLDEWRGKPCGVCKKFYRLYIEEGNMASKRKEKTV